MKKIVLISFAYLVSSFTFAQIDNSENNAKNLRFGLKGNLSVDWMKPENQKKFLSNGSSLGYGWGAQLEYRLNSNISVVTGVGIQTAKGKIGFYEASSKDSVFYILNKDEEFQKFDYNLIDSTGYSTFQLENRSYKINYVTIPIALKMKTKEIGYFTYYGTFGLNLGVKTKATVKDDVIISGSTETKTTNENLDLNSGASIARTGIIIGGGAEYTIAGSTALFFDLTYNYFFTNALNGNDKYLGVKDYQATNGFKDVNQKAIPGSVALTVGILF